MSAFVEEEAGLKWEINELNKTPIFDMIIIAW